MRNLPRHLSLLAAPVAAAAILVACSGGDAATPAPTITPPPGGVTTMAVELSSFKFVPKDLTFTTGQVVDLALHSTDLPHTFTVSGLGINVSLNGGERKTTRVSFAKAGSYKLTCEIAGHDAAGMNGTVTVR